MRVVCTLREIKEELSWSKTKLMRELDMDARTIDKLLDDTDEDSWRLDREALHRYFLFAHTYGFEPFRIEPHAIWRSFAGKDVTIFRGPKKADAPVENHLVDFLVGLNCDIISSTTRDGIEEAIRERNCVIIGSPKGNPASEVAFALLWGAEPFNAESKNRKKIPIKFLGMRAERNESSAMLEESSRYGLSILSSDSREPSYLKVDWISPEKFGEHKGTGQDGAVVVACNRPLGTPNDVTTIIIAGYTGLATLVATKELTHKRIPDLKLEENTGRPCLAALKFQFKKRRQYKLSIDSLRTPEEGSVKWAPPWHHFF